MVREKIYCSIRKIEDFRGARRVESGVGDIKVSDLFWEKEASLVDRHATADGPGT
jgi:hypothetical protein